MLRTLSSRAAALAVLMTLACTLACPTGAAARQSISEYFGNVPEDLGLTEAEFATEVCAGRLTVPMGESARRAGEAEHQKRIACDALREPSEAPPPEAVPQVATKTAPKAVAAPVRGSQGAPFVAEAAYGSIALPTPTSPVYIVSTATADSERITIAFRRPCNAQNDYDYKGIKLIAWKNPAGDYFHFTWCRDGSPYSVETFARGDAIAQMQAMMAASGSLRDTDGKTFSWAPFTVAKRYRIEYWSWPKLEQNWFVRTSRADTSLAAGPGGGPGYAAILSAHGKAYARSYNGQTTDTPGEVAYPSPFGGVAYYERRQLSEVSCRKVAAETFRCSYKVAKTFQAAADSLYGALTSAFMPDQPPTPFTYTYARKNGTWVSKGLDQQVYADALAAYQARQKAQASSGSSSSSSCTTYGGAALNWEGGGGMPNGVRWDPSIRTPC